MSWKDVNVGLKPVFLRYFGGLSFERKLSREEIGKIAEKEVEKLKSTLSNEVKILEPTVLESRMDIFRLKGDLAEVDLFLICGISGLCHSLAFMLGQLGKPVARVGPGVAALDICAYLRSRGMEAYAPLDYDELREIVHRLKVRKALSLSKVLLFTSTKTPISSSVASSAWNLDNIMERLGIYVDILPNDRLFDEAEKVSVEQAERLADDLISKAAKVEVNRENIVNSAKLYLALKILLRNHEADAVTINCIEPIFLEKKRSPPCVPFTLLKDEGIPAACEADLSVLLAMMLLMYLSDKSVFMGNLWIHDAEKNLVRVSHDVPGLRMRGFDQPALPYILHEYHGLGYGTTMYVEMDKGHEVTLARFSPNIDAILTAKGNIVGCHDGIFCRVTVDIEVSDARGFLHKAANYGHHFAVVYGDYLNELVKIGEMLKLKVETVA